MTKVKIADSKGRVTLGNKFAGQLVIISQDGDKIVVQLAKAIPVSQLDQK